MARLIGDKMQIPSARIIRKRAARHGSAALGALVALAASPALSQPTDAELIAQGRKIVTAQCSRCHQIALTGLSPMRAAPPFREVMQRYKPEALEEALAEGITTGHESMPEFVFEPDDVTAIVAYLGTLRAKR